ncbi:tetratricopeptide repeat protein [Sinimarinibacterium thermocellulolyticum]|uniref:Tetratricopeptide repeat protein n=1 Tax=Sinimarinibacterium thermocellulolyticum TaxID=3170016 RepID=A0ABV2A5B7_9GAMM
MKHALALLMLGAALTADATDVYRAGAAEDPHVRVAEYLNRDGRHLSAIVELRLLDPTDAPQRMPEAYRWQLADSYLSFGMRDRAQAIYRDLERTSQDKLRLGRAQLQLAEFEYTRGYWAEARATLYRMRETLPQELVEDWQDLLARVLMAEKRYGDAAEVLTDLDNSERQSAYTRYNLGVALINDGRAPQGLTALDRIGRLVPSNLEELALRDRANLSLGWYFLQAQQGGTAKPLFERVRLEGPFSNRALLGLGWAELAPQGERVRKARIGDEPDTDASPFTTFSTLGVLLRPGFTEEDIFRRAGLSSFRLSKASKKEEQALAKALVPWVELISRDPMDTAVQEAWLAIPFTLDRLGAYTQALEYYEKAIEVLEEARRRMQAAKVSIRQGRMVETIVRREIESEAGWRWKLLDLPDAPETYFLQHLLAEHRFQEALKNYRDTRMLQRSLESWSQRLSAAEQAHAASDRPPGDAEALIRRAQRRWTPPWAGLEIVLRAESSLSVPVAHGDGAYAEPELRPRLRLAASPARFNGPVERARAAQQRLADLKRQLAAAAEAQSKLLQDMSLADLDRQQQQIERYLIEARFALARLYDRHQKGELDEE